jgi:hypothetical protein
MNTNRFFKIITIFCIFFFSCQSKKSETVINPTIELSKEFNDSLSRLYVKQKKVIDKLEQDLTKIKLDGVSVNQLSIKEDEIKQQKLKDSEELKKLLSDRIDHLNWEIKTSINILRIKREINDSDNESTRLALESQTKEKAVLEQKLNNLNLN